MWEFLKDKDKIIEQKISYKVNGDWRYGNTPKVFASLLNFFCDNPVDTFSLCLLDQDYHVAFQPVKKFFLWVSL